MVVSLKEETFLVHGCRLTKMFVVKHVMALRGVRNRARLAFSIEVVTQCQLPENKTERSKTI